MLHSHEVNCCCLRYNLHLRAVITNQRLFVCKSLNRLLIIKKKALKKEGNWKSQAMQDSSREKTSTYQFFLQTQVSRLLEEERTAEDSAKSGKTSNQSNVKNKMKMQQETIYLVQLRIVCVFCVLFIFWFLKCHQNQILYLKLLDIPFFFINFTEVQISSDSNPEHLSRVEKSIFVQKSQIFEKKQLILIFVVFVPAHLCNAEPCKCWKKYRMTQFLYCFLIASQWIKRIIISKQRSRVKKKKKK